MDLTQRGAAALPRYTVTIATMRRKPVTRDEVRFDGERITTLPADAIHQLAPIPRLWAPLLRQLNQVNKKE